MRCSKCGAQGIPGKKFCAECGGPLSNRCSNCNSDNALGAKFCADCGNALSKDVSAEVGKPSAAEAAGGVPIAPEPQTSEALEGERKTVTALFADIKGSTELMEELDPEDARHVIDPALKLMMEAVHRYDGHVVQSTGDGIFALFGAPIAHEDHPQRALLSALRMQQEIKRLGSYLRAQGRAPIQIRIGLNTGEVVMRSIQTGERHAEYTAIGHTANLAARMQTLAEPGSVVASEATYRLCEGYFAFQALGPARIKGVSEPVEVYEVTGLGPLRTRLQRSAGRGLTKFVGRRREMEALRNAAELAKAGRGQIAAAMADAGVGKSRLFYEFKAVSQSGWMVLETFSISHGKASAYLPVIELLNNYFEVDPGDDARRRREKLAGRVIMLDRALEDTLPYLFALLGVEETVGTLAQMDAQVRQRRTLEAIKRILLRESLKQPLIVIFEDLHWVDAETQALLDLLAEAIASARVLLLVNYRPQYTHAWGSKTYYTQLRLDPLGRESAEEMLTALLGDSVELRPLKRLIIEKTEGNPFFMEETVQVLFDEGSLVRDGTLRITKSLSDLKIPPTVQGILAARIDRLPADQKELLQTLAVIGKEFPLGLITRVLDPHPPGAEPGGLSRERAGEASEKLERMLGDLQLGEFIYEQPALPDVEYTFKHALTQEVAYNSLLAERRRAIHERTADAIEALYPDRLDDYLSELAHHYQLSNNPTKAVRYSHLAAAQASNRAAYAEAARTLEVALKLLDRLPVGAERLRAELALRTTENTVARVLYGFSSQECQRATKRMCELGEELGETAPLLRGLINLAILHFALGEPLRTLELGGRCLELAEGAEGDVLASVHYILASGAHTCGRLDEAVSRYRDSLRHAEQASRQGFLTPFNLWSASMTQACSVLQLLGRGVEALRLAEEGLRRARDSKHLFSLGHALSTMGWFHQYRREPEIVRAHAEAAIALSEENGFAEWMPWGRFHRGWAMAELGQVEQGVAEMEAGVAGFRRLGGVPRRQFTIAMLAQGYARLGRRDEALGMLEEGLAHIERTGERVDEAEMLRLRGELLLMGGESATAEAEHCFRTAIDVARGQEAKWWELRATVSLARLLANQGRRAEARAMLAEIYGWFTEDFDTADLKDAKAVLDELGG